jgi:hypothetical protein
MALDLDSSSSGCGHGARLTAGTHSALFLALALVAGLLVVGPRSEARVAYPAPQMLSAEDDDAFDPQVGVDPQGRATVVWRRFDGSNWRIQSVRLGADGAPGQVQTLSATGQDAFAPQIAIDPRGHASVVWRRFDGTKWRIQTVHLGADGAPGTVESLTGSAQDAFEPQVAVDPEGFATIAWRRFDGSNWRIQVIRQNPTGGGGFPVFTLSPAGQSSFSPQVALGPEGGATVVWEQEVAPGRREIHEMRLRADFSFAGPPQRLSPSGQDARDARAVHAQLTGMRRSEEEDVLPRQVQRQLREAQQHPVGTY